MSVHIREKLAESLAAETTEIIPFIPYLLRDFWSLGVNPVMIQILLKRNVDINSELKILDLACGKGAVSVMLAKMFGLHVTGIDLMAEFIDVARVKADENKVQSLCSFIVGDVDEYVTIERDFHCAIYSAVGPVMGNVEETLRKLSNVVVKGGGVILDNYDYLDDDYFYVLLKRVGFELVDVMSEAQVDDSTCCSYELIDNSSLGMKAITQRAKELSFMHPELSSLFNQYVLSQQEEYAQIQRQPAIKKVIWFLRKL